MHSIAQRSDETWDVIRIVDSTLKVNEISSTIPSKEVIINCPNIDEASLMCNRLNGGAATEIALFTMLANKGL